MSDPHHGHRSYRGPVGRRRTVTGFVVAIGVVSLVVGAFVMAHFTADGPRPRVGQSVAPGTMAAGSAGRSDCADTPSRCGYPDATNTGVDSRKRLRTSGCVTADQAGQVIENLAISDCGIEVTAREVQIRNVRIEVSDADGFAVIVRPGASAKISDVEITGRDKAAGSVQYAILSQSDLEVSIERANLHRCADCIQGERLRVTDTYIHDLANPPGAHVDGIQCNSVCEITVRHNTILNEWGQTAAIALFADFGIPRDSLIEDNLLAGGGYTVYGGGAKASGIVVNANRFARHMFPRGGQFGPGAHLPTGSAMTWTANIWDDTGAVVERP